MFCPNCGAKLRDDSIFCEECGTRISGMERQPQEQQSEPASAGQEQSEAEDVRREGQPPYAPLPPQYAGHSAPPESERRGSSGRFKYVLAGIAVIALIIAAVTFFRKGGDDGGSSEPPAKSEAVTDRSSEAAPAVTQTSAATAAPDTKALETPAAQDTTAAQPPAETTPPAETPSDTEPAPQEPAAPEGMSAEEMAAIAARLSTDEPAYALDFEWLLDIILLDGDGAGAVVTDESRRVQITDGMQPLLNGGWKAFMHTADPIYESDIERYFNAELSVSDNDFTITANWKYLFDPSEGTTEETGSEVFRGTYDPETGTASALCSYAKIEFEGFYISDDHKAEYAIGKFYWISGEVDVIGLMRVIG